MKITKNRLKQIIKEEIGRFLKEQSAVTINFEGTKTSIEFLGMETKYNQTEVKLSINGEVSSFVAYEIDDLADKVIAELGDKDEDYYYWFLGDYPDEKQVSQFKGELKKALEGMGADPESASETRASYSPENVYELKQIIKEEIEALTEEDESIEDLMKAIGGLMKDLGYKKARKAVESAIDFDEKVENMKDLKALITKLRSEKDPMGRGRKEELGDIKNALKAALSKMSK